jgi:hypothetical protein
MAKLPVDYMRLELLDDVVDHTHCSYRSTILGELLCTLRCSSALTARSYQSPTTFSCPQATFSALAQ